MTARVLDWADGPAIGDALRSGALVVLPTDTVPGFSCLVHSADALRRIRRIKGLDDERGFVVLAASAEAVLPWLDARQNADAWEFVRHAWPAPLTAILAVAGTPPASVAGHEGATWACRVPAHASLRRVLAGCDVPIVSTSVNRHGEPPCLDPDAILERFGDSVDVVVRAPVDPAARASSLVDCTGWPPRTLRAGAFDLEAALSLWHRRSGGGTI